MESQRTPPRRGDAAKALKSEFEERRRDQIVRLAVRSRTRRLRSLLIGAGTGIGAVAAICIFQYSPFYWHSAVWEAALCGLAGYLLARANGGFLNGLVLFGLAYMGAIALRETGYDSSQVIAHFPKPREVGLHADFAAFFGIAAIGGLIGFATDGR